MKRIRLRQWVIALATVVFRLVPRVRTLTKTSGRVWRLTLFLVSSVNLLALWVFVFVPRAGAQVEEAGR